MSVLVYLVLPSSLPLESSTDSWRSFVDQSADICKLITCPACPNGGSVDQKYIGVEQMNNALHGVPHSNESHREDTSSCAFEVPTAVGSQAGVWGGLLGTCGSCTGETGD